MLSIFILPVLVFLYPGEGVPGGVADHPGGQPERPGDGHQGGDRQDRGGPPAHVELQVPGDLRQDRHQHPGAI